MNLKKRLKEIPDVDKMTPSDMVCHLADLTGAIGFLSSDSGGRLCPDEEYEAVVSKRDEIASAFDKLFSERSRWLEDYPDHVLWPKEVPLHIWLQENRESLLSEYPDHFVAIHPEQGVVAAGKTSEEFEAAFDRLPKETQDESVSMHTSMPL